MKKQTLTGWAVLGIIMMILLAAAQKPGKYAFAGTEPYGVKRHPAICCESHIPSRFAIPAPPPYAVLLPKGERLASSRADDGVGSRASAYPDAAARRTHPGMVWIPGGTFMMGADNDQAAEDEYPKHRVTVDGFWMDATEVTNAAFKKFVRATGYVTTAQRKPDWEMLKAQLPPGTPRPDDSVLVPASLVFSPPDHPVA